MTTILEYPFIQFPGCTFCFAVYQDIDTSKDSKGHEDIYSFKHVKHKKKKGLQFAPSQQIAHSPPIPAAAASRSHKYLSLVFLGVHYLKSWTHILVKHSQIADILIMLPDISCIVPLQRHHQETSSFRLFVELEMKFHFFSCDFSVFFCKTCHLG